MFEQFIVFFLLEDEVCVFVVKKCVGCSVVIGVIFFMVISVIGLGFIMQMVIFIVMMGVVFVFVIFVLIFVDIVVQLNIWCMIIFFGKCVGEFVNSVIFYFGYVIVVFVVIGGLVFNIGNIVGGGFGLNVLFGIDLKFGGVFIGVFVIIIFLIKKVGCVMDIVFVVFGLGMIVMMLIVVFVVQLLIGEVLCQIFVLDELNFVIIMIIVGGIVGGYIIYFGVY